MKNILMLATLAAVKRHWLLTAIFVVIVVVIWNFRDLIYLSLNAPTVTPVKEKIAVHDFSPDGKKLYIDYCNPVNSCSAGWLDIPSKHVSLFALQNTKDVVSSSSSSADGRQLAIVIKEAVNNYETSQIGLLDMDKNTYRAVTHSPTFKEWPSVSIDGKKIIYAQASRIRKSGKTRFSGWDIYETDIATGVERRLTDFDFSLIDRPQYLADGRKFVFSAEYPSYFNSQHSHGEYTLKDLESANRSREIYKNQYQNNTIFLMTGVETTLKPLFTNGEHSHGPTLSRDGKIFFISITNKMDSNDAIKFYNYDLFVYENGIIKRLTKLETAITGSAVTAQGEMIAYLSDKLRNGHSELWLMDVSSGQHQKINLGEHSTFSTINIFPN